MKCVQNVGGDICSGVVTETRRPKDNFRMVLREIKFENGRWMEIDQNRKQRNE
jgi:hypothetical protein